MKNSLTFLPPSAVRSMLRAADFDPSDPWDRMIAEEAALLGVWNRMPFTLVHTPLETCAHGPTGIVAINSSQLAGIYRGLAGDELKTAVFFALAHEFGHLTQALRLKRKHFRQLETRKREAEGHADILAGAWLAVRLAGGETRLPDHLREIAFRLKAEDPTYPSYQQRLYLAERGMGLAAMVLDAESRVGGEHKIDELLAQHINNSDLRDLYRIVKQTLRDTPAEQRSAPAMTGPFRRANVETKRTD